MLSFFELFYFNWIIHWLIVYIQLLVRCISKFHFFVFFPPGNKFHFFVFSPRKSMPGVRFWEWSVSFRWPEADSRNCTNADTRQTRKQNSQGKWTGICWLGTRVRGGGLHSKDTVVPHKRTTVINTYPLADGRFVYRLLNNQLLD